ncbi:MAG: T9SS type A sorting domain-containing protein, partial [Flavobacteriaceae bacterium]
LIYKIRTSLNTFGSDNQPDKLSIKVSDVSFSSTSTPPHTIWETTTEHDPDLKFFDIKTYLQSSWNLDYTQFRIGVVFDDIDGSNGWGAGIDDVSFYARQYNDRPYSNLQSNYVISSLPYNYSQEADNQATTSPASLPTGINSHMSNGLWYKYVADFTGELTIHGKADDYDIEIGAYRQNGNAWTTVGTMDATLSGDLESLKINVTNGHTYWFNLGYYSGTNTNPTMQGTQHIWVAKTPANDLCVNAIDFTSDAHNANFDDVDVTGATNNSGFITTCGSGMNDGIWYKFTAPATGEYNFWLNGGLGDLAVSVYTGSCGAFSCVTSAVLQGLQDNGFAVTQGTTYYFNIGDSSNTEDIVENYSTDIKFYYTPPANDMCTNGTTLTVGNNFDHHDVVAELLGCTPTLGITTYSCSSGFGNGNDIWYELTVPSNGAVRVETAAFVGSTISDTVLAAYTGTCNNLQEIACNDDGGTGNFTVLDITGQTSGSTIYIRASDWGANNFDKFKISAYNLSTVAVENDTIEGLNLYPNPITNVLNIDSQEEITQLSIYSLLGKLVKKVQPNETTSSIDLSDLATGIYMVKIEASEKVITKKIIKK